MGAFVFDDEPGNIVPKSCFYTSGTAQALWQTRVDKFGEAITGPYAGQDWNSLTPGAEKSVKDIEAQFLKCINRLLATQRLDLGDEWILRDSGCLSDAGDQPLLQVEQMQYQLARSFDGNHDAGDLELLRAFKARRTCVNIW